MALRIFRFVTLMFAALALGLAFCHLMEMPARLEWGRDLWVDSTVRGGLYRMFGTVGAVIAVGSVALTLVLAVLTRARARRVFWLSAAGAAFFAFSLVTWWAVVFPANLELATWLQGPVPDDWSATRLRWETGHMIGAVLEIAGFSFLLGSVLAETPDRPPAR